MIRALKMIDIAKNAGVDAIKFQTYSADDLISNLIQNININQKVKLTLNQCIKCLKDVSYQKIHGSK